MKPYYEDEAATIYHGDCREVLPLLSVGAVVTDPPYGTGSVRGEGGIGQFHGRREIPEWDHWSTDWWEMVTPSWWTMFCPWSRADEVASRFPSLARVSWRKTNPRP